MEKLRIVFWGTPEFAKTCLAALLAADFCEVVGVVTQPDRKVGRKQILTPPPVKSLADEFGVSVIQPESVKGNMEILGKLKLWQTELNVVVAYGHILPLEVLEVGKFGSVNVHGSLLPKFRGASPVQAALLAGEKKTGVTIMKMNEEMDAGDILVAEETKIGADETADILMERLANMGAAILVESLKRLVDGQLCPLQQNNDEATFCGKIQRTDGEVDWGRDSAETIFNKLRAFTPWPGIYTLFEGKRLKILKATWTDEVIENAKAGDLVKRNDSSAAFVCREGLFLPIEVQIEGKQAMTIEAFVQGYLSSK